MIDPDNAQQDGDEMSGTGEIGKMRRTKPISLNPSASWKRKIRFKLRQIPALVRDLTSGVALPGEGSTPREVARVAADGRLANCAA
jgi:hypothetical protein